MRSFRIVPRLCIAIALAVFTGLASPARSRAAHPVDQQLASSSILSKITDDQKRSPEKVSAAAVSKGLDAAQIQQTADYLIDQVMPTVQALVFTMLFSTAEVVNSRNGPPPSPPIVTVSMVVQAPPTPSDFPPDPPGDPTPSGFDSPSPEPGTLIGGLVGAGALLCSYYRRRRAKSAGEPEGSDEACSEIELAIP